MRQNSIKTFVRLKMLYFLPKIIEIMFLAGFLAQFISSFGRCLFYPQCSLVGFWCIFMFFGVVIPMWLTEGLARIFREN